MQDNKAHQIGRSRSPHAAREPVPLTDRLAFTVSEFAALFGRSATWGYRKIYEGAIKPLAGNGRLLVSRTEIDKLLATATEYGRDTNGGSA